jgi:hypothetical protein
MASNWTESEVEAAVADYFDMLRSELTGRKYNKTAHRRALMEQLNNRSDGSVELKHQNISAVLIEMGIPYIDGYKPRSNYQRALLPAAVSEFLKNHAEFHALFKADSEAVPTIPTVSDFLAAMEAPPSEVGRRPDAVSDAPAVYNPVGVNYLEREARNQSLGDAGEQFVLNFERARLIYAGKSSLAERIEQESFARSTYTLNYNILNNFFQIPAFTSSSLSEINPVLRQTRLISSLILPHDKDFCPGSSVRAHLSRYTGTTSRVFAPFFRLNANCLNIKSMRFLKISVKRALSPLSYLWLMPKYCSTIYRYLEMALFRWISNSVNLALMLSFRMIPSPILFKARNSRFGPPVYPLSAYAFSMGSLVCIL